MYHKPSIILSLLLAALSYTPIAVANDDSGVHYTIPLLATIDGAGVIDNGDGIYTMTHDIMIDEENTFSIEGVRQLRICDGVTFTIGCHADLKAPDTRVLITRDSETSNPCGLEIAYNDRDAQKFYISNIDFEYVGLKSSGTVGFYISDCTFRYANGRLTGTAALCVGNDGASFDISNCTFEDCTVPAIGGPANYACGLYIAECTFINNNTSNTNKPQLNLTVGGDMPVTIVDCTLRGSGLNMVGGIAVGNLLARGGSNEVNIVGCTVTDHRYGLTGVGPMNMYIADNTLINNKYETNPMNGGSGISLAGYGYGLDAIVTGNHIENSLWGITLIACRNVSLGEIDNPDSPGENTFLNNGNNGVPYDLYNNQTATVYAQNNTWSVAQQTSELIESVIFHKADDPSLGEVIFMPANTGNCIASDLEHIFPTIEGRQISCREAVSIYDTMGTLLVPATHNPSISGLAPGVYVARTASTVLKFSVN